MQFRLSLFSTHGAVGIPAREWVWILAVTFGAWVLVALMAVFTAPLWLRLVVRKTVGHATRLLFTEPYTKNLLEGLTALRKFGVQWTAENELRAHIGKPLEKPIGTTRTFPHFDQLLFTPAQLHRRPLDHSVPVNLTTVLGRRAQRPMRISMPVMVSAMGYGVALSKPFVRAIAKGTAIVGTACNAGQGPVLDEFRQLAHRFVVQYHGATWRPSPSVLGQADMIEIRFGQGANAGCGTVISGDGLTPEVLKDLGMSVSAGDAYIPAGLHEVRRTHDLRRLVTRLRLAGGGSDCAEIGSGQRSRRRYAVAV